MTQSNANHAVAPDPAMSPRPMPSAQPMPRQGMPAPSMSPAGMIKPVPSQHAGQQMSPPPAPQPNMAPPNSGAVQPGYNSHVQTSAPQHTHPSGHMAPGHMAPGQGGYPHSHPQSHVGAQPPMAAPSGGHGYEHAGAHQGNTAHTQTYDEGPGYPQQTARQYAGQNLGQVPSGYEDSYAYASVPVERNREGGERALPNISIQAFCERSETANVIHEMSNDWRMRRTNVKIFMGGLPAAGEYYQKESTPRLILVESGMRGDELFAQLEQLASVCDEGTQVIIIGATNDIKLYRRLIEEGVSDYLVPPFHPLSMIRAISDIFVDPEKPFTGRVAAFFGAKGGVGSSTIAHNVAWALSEQLKQETTLVDLDASWGTTGLDFAYDTSEGLEQALSKPDRLDETLLDRILLRHTDRLSILPSASMLTKNPISDADAFEKVVNEVRGVSPMTVLDMPHVWSDWSTSVLVGCDDVVITAVPDLANLRNTKNLIDYMNASRPNDNPPILVLNKMGMSKRQEISVKDFAAAVGMEPALVIGFDPETFLEAANDGKMLSDMKQASSTVQGLAYLAGRLKTGSFGQNITQKSGVASAVSGGASASPVMNALGALKSAVNKVRSE